MYTLAACCAGLVRNSRKNVAGCGALMIIKRCISSGLAAAKFHEILRVHVDQHGHIRGIWYQTLATGCPPGGSLPKKATKLVTSVSVDMESKGPKLAVEPKPKSPEEEVAAKQPPQSFMQKYWMYMLGGVVLLSLMGGEDDSKGGARPGPKK